MPKLYTWEIRTEVDFECLSFRDWLHDARSFETFPTQQAALDAAKAAIEAEEDDDGGKVSIIEWNTKDYVDGGAWFASSDGEEGRVLVHTINVPASTFETIDQTYRSIEFYVFFVMGGFENGNADFLCLDANEHPLEDGFYFSVEGEEQPLGGPFDNWQEVIGAAHAYFDGRYDEYVDASPG